MKLLRKIQTRYTAFEERRHSPLSRKQRMRRLAGAAIAGAGAVFLGRRLVRAGRAVEGLFNGATSIPMKRSGKGWEIAGIRHRATQRYTKDASRPLRHAKWLRVAGGGLMLAGPTAAGMYGTYQGMRGTRFDEKSKRHKEFMATASRTQKMKYHAQNVALSAGLTATGLALAPGVPLVLGRVAGQAVRKNAQRMSGFGRSAYRAWKYRKVRGLPSVLMS